MKNYFSILSILNISFFLLFILQGNWTFAQTDCPQGMVSYWKLDESGPTVFFLDSFGNLNAECTGTECPSEDIGIINKARNFNGSNQIIVADDNVFDWGINASFSLEVWVKTTQPGTGNKVFIGKDRGGSNMSWWLGYGSDNKVVFSVRDSSDIRVRLEGSTIINDGDWHHIAGVKNGNLNLLQIFVDGKKEAEVSTFFTGDFAGNDPISIGYYGDNYHFTGVLDEVAIYDTALNETQLADHYTNGLMGINYCDNSTTVEDEEFTIDNFQLYQNYPNPFNPITKIKFIIPAALSGSWVSLTVYDVLGNEVANLLNEEKHAGLYEVEFSTYSAGRELSSGMYFFRLQVGNLVDSKKMIILK